MTGNLRDYETDRLGFLTRLAADYGPVATFDRTTTAISDPALARTVLNGMDGAVVIRNNVLQEPIPAEELGAWPLARRSINPVLRRSAIRRRCSRVVELAQRHVTSSVAAAPAIAYWESYTSAVSADYFFGPDAEAIPALVHDLLRSLPAVVGNVFALPAWLRTPGRQRIRRRFSELHSHLLPLLRSRWERPGDYDDGASELVLLANRRNPDADDLSRLCNMVIGSLLASYTVPAAGLSWVSYLLDLHPMWLTPIRDEAERLLRTSDGSDDWLLDAPYTTAVLLESFRMFPPTWLLTRHLSRPVLLGGYVLPAGHTIMLSPYVMQRSSDAFADPSSFDPGRWVDSGSTNANNLFAFGAGPRSCPGRDFAMLTCGAAIASLAVHRTFETDGDPTPDPRFTLQPQALDIRLSG